MWISHVFYSLMCFLWCVFCDVFFVMCFLCALRLCLWLAVVYIPVYQSFMAQVTGALNISSNVKFCYLNLGLWWLRRLSPKWRNIIGHVKLDCMCHFYFYYYYFLFGQQIKQAIIANLTSSETIIRIPIMYLIENIMYLTYRIKLLSSKKIVGVIGQKI